MYQCENVTRVGLQCQQCGLQVILEFFIASDVVEYDVSDFGQLTYDCIVQFTIIRI